MNTGNPQTNGDELNSFLKFRSKKSNDSSNITKAADQVKYKIIHYFKKF